MRTVVVHQGWPTDIASLPPQNRIPVSTSIVVLPGGEPILVLEMDARLGWSWESNLSALDRAAQ